MYAFKTERPDAARRYHNKFVTGTNYQEESNRRFALSEPTENILRTSILESGWLIKNITLRDVNAVSGNAVNIGASELYTGRVDGGRFHKKMAINGTEFFLTETDTCARISYSDMSHIYHTGVPDEFEKTVESFFAQAYALDMLRVGFNGVSIANTTNPEINKKGEDVNIGWHALAKAYGNGKQTSVECLAVSNFDSLVNHRCQFIAGHQQFIKPGDPRSGAFIVYDNDTESLYINGENGSKRSDCDEARERGAMGILLALQYQRTSDKKLMDALNNYVSFIRRIQKPDYTTNSTVDFKSKNRGYNYPWVADFWFTMFRTTGNKQYLKDGYGTLRALVRYFKHGFYCINIPTYGYTLLKENGFTAEADTLLNDFKSMADVFCENGPNYPTSEVNYEQSIVAPSIIHLLNVYMLTGDEKYLKGAESQLPLLESFSGKQPSFHLYDIAIRHWDGYWFGKDRIWGDTFPHYWSTLSGIAFRLYAKATGKQEYTERALNIFRNNLCLFTEDGRGSCAFIYPDKVNGQKAHLYDPFANDQDWAMVFWLEYGPDFK